MTKTTLRNVMLTMLVLGAAGSLVSLGTFATFNATIKSAGNTFATGQIRLDGTVRGTACTGNADNTAAVADCAHQVGTYSQMLPGDSKFGSLQLTNNTPAGAPTQDTDMTLSMSIADGGGSSIPLTSNGINASGTTANGPAGLGLIVFECLDGSNNDTDCGGTVASLYPVYGACTSNPAPAAALATTTFSTSGVTDNGIKVATILCHGGNTGTTTGGLHGLTVPLVTGAGAALYHTGGATSAALPTLKTDNLVMLLYLPLTADATVANNTTTSLTYTYTGTLAHTGVSQ